MSLKRYEPNPALTVGCPKHVAEPFNLFGCRDGRSHLRVNVPCFGHTMRGFLQTRSRAPQVCGRLVKIAVLDGPRRVLIGHGEPQTDLPAPDYVGQDLVRIGRGEYCLPKLTHDSFATSPLGHPRPEVPPPRAIKSAWLALPCRRSPVRWNCNPDRGQCSKSYRQGQSSAGGYNPVDRVHGGDILDTQSAPADAGGAKSASPSQGAWGRQQWWKRWRG